MYSLSVIKDMIENFEFFKSLDVSKIENYINEGLLEIKEYSTGETIYSQSDKCVSLDFIVEGCIQIYKTNEDGTIFIINEFYDGEMYGGNLLFSSYPIYPMNIEAIKNTIIIRAKKDFIIDISTKDKGFLQNLLKSLSDNAAFVGDRLRYTELKTLREKIVEFLIKESKKQNSMEIVLYKTKKALANNFGVQRTSLSRELKKMSDDGLIKLSKNKITIIRKLSD
jgi:CRP-like cAMP-binding protein